MRFRGGSEPLKFTRPETEFERMVSVDEKWEVQSNLQWWTLQSDERRGVSQFQKSRRQIKRVSRISVNH